MHHRTHWLKHLVLANGVMGGSSSGRHREKILAPAEMPGQGPIARKAFDDPPLRDPQRATGSGPHPGPGAAFLPVALPPGGRDLHLRGHSPGPLPGPGPLGGRGEPGLRPHGPGHLPGGAPGPVPEEDAAVLLHGLPRSPVVPQRRLPGQRGAPFLRGGPGSRPVLPGTVPRGGPRPPGGQHHGPAPG